MNVLDDQQCVLSDTAVLIWNALKATGSVDQTAQQLAQEFDASPAAIATDVFDLVTRLVEADMIESA